MASAEEVLGSGERIFQQHWAYLVAVVYVRRRQNISLA